MQSISSVETLHKAIAVLETRRREQEDDLVDHFLVISEKLRPVNIIKSAVRTVAQSPDLQYDLLVAAIQLGSRYLSRMLLFRSGPFNKILGLVLQFGTAKFIRTKGNAIKAGALHLLHGFLVKHNGNGAH